MSTDFNFNRYLGEVSPEELVSMYKGAARDKNRSKRNAIEREIISRLHRARKNDKKIFTEGRDPQYPGNQFALHPFESQLSSPRIRRKLKKDHSFTADIFSQVCKHLLFRSERSIIGNVQLDLFIDNYSVSGERLSGILTKIIGTSDRLYFQSTTRQGREAARAKEFLNRIGWDIKPTDKPPLLNDKEREKTEGSSSDGISRRGKRKIPPREGYIL